MKIEKSINNENNPKRNLEDIKSIIVHHTGSKGSDEANKNYLNRDDYISAHYMIGKDGKIYQLMDLDRIAYHAGVSKCKGLKSKGNSLNWCSIGIEVNSDGKEFTNAQRRSTKSLIIKLMEDFDINPELVLRHKDIAPNRKWDIGASFYQSQFNTWKDYQENLKSIFESLKMCKDSWLLAQLTRKENPELVRMSEIMVKMSLASKNLRDEI